MRYIILAKGSHEGFKEPRQLTKINGERILDRTIRLLKENGINEILVTGNYTDIKAKVIDPEGNDYNYKTGEGYWLNAFNGLLEEPTCFIWGDVYFSGNAIKTIVETKEETFFGSHFNKSKDYIKDYDEPYAYKVYNIDRFKKHIEKVKHLYDLGKCKRNPIIWEVYRSIHNININKHIITTDFIEINDITCDIDNPQDIAKLKFKLGECKMVRVKATTLFTYSKFDKVKELVRAEGQGNADGTIYVGDTFLVDNEEAKYLTETADWCKTNGPLVEIIEVIPDKKEEKPKKTTKRSKK